MSAASNPAIYFEFFITGVLTDNGTWDTIPIRQIGASGTFTNAMPVIINVDHVGNLGGTGRYGSGGQRRRDRRRPVQRDRARSRRKPTKKPPAQSRHSSHRDGSISIRARRNRGAISLSPAAPWRCKRNTIVPASLTAASVFSPPILRRRSRASLIVVLVAAQPSIGISNNTDDYSLVSASAIGLRHVENATWADPVIMSYAAFGDM